jgi:fatty acid synthase
MSILKEDLRALLVPVRIDELRCDPKVLKTEAFINSYKIRAVYDSDLNIGVCNGLEYRGLKKSLMNRNLNSQKPLLANYRFATYDQLITYENDIQLYEYSKACDRLAVYLANKMKISINSIPMEVNKYEDNEKLLESEYNEFSLIENKHLINIIRKLIECNHEIKLKSQIYDNLSDLDKDFMINAFNEKCFLDNILVAVYQNRFGSELQILEINESSDLMHSNVMKTYELYDNDMKINYSLLHPSPGDLSADILTDIKTQICNFNVSIDSKLIASKDLIIYKDISVCQITAKSSLNMKSTLESFWNGLKANGFLLIICRNSLTIAEQVICQIFNIEFYNNRKNEIISEAQKLGFILIANNSDEFKANALLFRKIVTDIKIEKQVFIHISDEYKLWFERLQTELKSIHLRPEGENIWLIADDKPTNGIIGFVKCLRKEPNGDRIRCIFNFDRNCKKFITKSTKYDIHLENIIKKDLKYNVIQNDISGHFIFTKIESIAKPVLTEHCYLNASTKGDLSSLKWFESQHKYWPIGRKENEILCNIYFSALNFKDIMLATGQSITYFILNFNQIL